MTGGQVVRFMPLPGGVYRVEDDLPECRCPSTRSTRMPVNIWIEADFSAELTPWLARIAVPSPDGLHLVLGNSIIVAIAPILRAQIYARHYWAVHHST